MKGIVFVALAAILLSPALSCGDQQSTEKEPLQKAVSEDLARMVEEDQRLRSTDKIDWDYVAGIDQQHREAVFDYLVAGAITEPRDMYHAALILQHADPTSCTECYLLAYKLSLAALAQGLEEARSMAPLNIDRYLIFTGRPQKFGTQSNIDSVGHYFLYPVDTLTSDSERAVWGLPPLDSIKASLERQNQR